MLISQSPDLGLPVALGGIVIPFCNNYSFNTLISSFLSIIKASGADLG